MLKKLLEDKSIILKTIFVLIIVNIGNATSLAIQIILSKSISIDNFSFFYSSIALISLCISPIISQHLIIQENISIFGDKKGFIKFYINKLYKIFSFFIFLYLFFFFIFFDEIQKYLNNYNDIIYYKLFGILIFCIISLVPSSFLISQKKYSLPSKIFTTLDIFRFIILVIYFFFYNGESLDFLINIQLIFVGLIFIFNHIFMSKSLKVKPEQIKDNNNSIYKNSKIALYSMVFPIILQLDIVIVTYLFDSLVTSQYIVVSTISKIIYFFFGSIYPIIFNEFLNKLKKIQFGLVIFYIFAIILGGICIIIGGKYFIIFTYDENFHASTKLIYLISPAIILLSITNIICGYLISEKCYSFIKYFIIIVILFTAISVLYSKTLLVFIYMFFTMCLLIFIVSMLNLIILNSKKTLMKIK
jgi:hypothetical protein